MKEYRYILRTRGGDVVLQPNGQPYAYPSYMSAVRGRAMLNPSYLIIQQERINDDLPTAP
jgi:hypothetical protein